MLKTRRIYLLSIIFLILPMTSFGAAKNDPGSEWIIISSDLKDDVKQTVKSEVEKKDSFSTLQEEAASLKTLEDEISASDASFRDAVARANDKFNKSKKKRDELNIRFQTASSELEELQKNVSAVKTGIENYDKQISRLEEDIKTQQESLKKWLKTEKQGEAVVAVIYTRGFKDTAHSLDEYADSISMPILTERMGVYVQSFTTLISGRLLEDFIKTTTEGTAKWSGEEPLRIELQKGNRGTVYLRIKRYELYPFQSPQAASASTPDNSDRMKAALISSVKDLEEFLSKNGYEQKDLDLSRADKIVKEALQDNRQASEGLNEQVKTFQENISGITGMIKNAKADKEIQTGILNKKLPQLEASRNELETIRKKKDAAEEAFHEAQMELQEKKRAHDSIIIKTALTAPKGAQTPADAVSEAIIDKLEEVKNDARTQHSSSTVTVVNAKFANETSAQAVTEAKITEVRLISFINEGDSVKVKVAFKVRTMLSDQPELEKEWITLNRIKVTGEAYANKNLADKNDRMRSAVIASMAAALREFAERMYGCGSTMALVPEYEKKMQGEKADDIKFLQEKKSQYETGKLLRLYGNLCEKSSVFGPFGAFTIKGETITKNFSFASDVINLTFNDGQKKITIKVQDFTLADPRQIKYYDKLFQLLNNEGVKGEFNYDPVKDIAAFYLTYTREAGL